MESVQLIRQKLAGIFDLKDPYVEQLREDQRKGVQQALLQLERRVKAKEKRQAQFMAMQELENAAFQAGYTGVIGVDEVGRGPLAGPVVVAAVKLPFPLTEDVGLDDSKRLAKEDRERLAKWVKEKALAYAIVEKSSQAIDESNILAVTKQAMVEAVQQIASPEDFVLIDAVALEISNAQSHPYKGDQKSLSIAAASCLAKVYRDQLMVEWDQRYSAYHFAQNKGYGTKDHLRALEECGPCPIHRFSFAPVQEAQKQGEA